VSEREGSLAPEDLLQVVGAVIFASDEPVAPREIADALGGLDVAAVERAIGELASRCAEGGIGLRVEWVAGGVRMATSSEVAEWVRRFFRQRNRARLSAAALETLAIVAYRQPVTSPEIQAIRGKDPSAALHGLLERKLVRSLGRKKVVGHPLLYGTTRDFLVHFGLNSLDDLPSIEDFEELVGALAARQASAFEPASDDASAAGDGVPAPREGEEGELGRGDA
jgi:segregation and condensation protein B